jgi:hypothetical protein
VIRKTRIKDKIWCVYREKCGVTGLLDAIESVKHNDRGFRDFACNLLDPPDRFIGYSVHGVDEGNKSEFGSFADKGYDMRAVGLDSLESRVDAKSDETEFVAHAMQLINPRTSMQGFGDSDRRRESQGRQVAKRRNGVVDQTGIGNAVRSEVTVAGDDDCLIHTLSVHDGNPKVQIERQDVEWICVGSEIHPVCFKRSHMVMTIDDGWAVGRHGFAPAS